MNVGKTQTVQLKAAQEAVDHFAAFLKTTRPLRKALARLAETSAILYLFSMTVLKDMAAMLSDPHKWAKRVEGQQGKEMAAWVRKPSDEEKLRKALAAELVAKAKHNAAPGKRKGLASSSDGSGDAASKSESAGSGSASSSSSESAGSKATSKKAKKSRK